VLTTANCGALVPVDNLKSGVRRGGKAWLWRRLRTASGRWAG
jgi:hypothetical protein